MIRKVFYRYNPETDNFERYYPSVRERALAALKYAATGICLGAVFLLVSYWMVGGPTESALRRENAELRTRYNQLSKRLDNSLKVMENIKNRDDNFYRVMMQMEPLPRSSRYAGLDNSGRYADMSALSDAALVTKVNRQMDLLDRQLYAQSLSFDQLREGASLQQDRLAHIPSVLPINIKDFTMSSGYGYRRDPVYGAQRFHEGLDFAAPTGTEVYATADGVVAVAERKGGYGNMIDISHGYNYLTRYAHLNSILVEQGESVKRGQLIGLVGSTGKSTGPHLHYEVRFKDEPQNPVNYYFMDLSPEEYTDMIQLAENAGHVMD